MSTHFTLPKLRNNRKGSIKLWTLSWWKIFFNRWDHMFWCFIKIFQLFVSRLSFNFYLLVIIRPTFAIKHSTLDFTKKMLGERKREREKQREFFAWDTKNWESKYRQKWPTDHNVSGIHANGFYSGEHKIFIFHCYHSFC